MLSSDAAGALKGRQDQIQPMVGLNHELYTYELRVIQQPLRARMCGFGEKDRRPCTPPPILQLFIYDRVTGQHIDIEHIDTSFFTATCNLFSADMDTEMDLIRQRNSHDSGHGSSSSSAVAAAAAAAAAAMMQKSIQQQTQLDPPMSGASPTPPMGNVINSTPTTITSIAQRSDGCSGSSAFHGLGNNATRGNNGCSVVASMAQTVSLPPHSQQHQHHSSSSMIAAAAAAAAAANASTSMAFPTGGGMGVGGSPSDTVRNLIGSSISTGSKLQNLDSSLGIFFVFPDLSIRKDGEYRLRFSFFDLRSETGDLIRTSSPIMARTFSDPFKVYSAKQFPGMIESTSLSKHFAKQGVKIPVRKESGKSSHSAEDDLE